jgi:hypothetical protein
LAVSFAMVVMVGAATTAWAQGPFAAASAFGPFQHQATLTAGGLTAVDGDIALIAADGVVHVFERDPVTEAWMEVTQLSPGDNATGFGRALAIDGAQAIVGAEGAAYVFRRRTDATWREVTKLIPSDGAENFGGSVDIDGRHAIVGTIGSAGGAYVFMTGFSRLA